MNCAAPLPAAMRRFALQDIAPQPWRNGGGLTREIAAGRIAVGDTDAAAPECSGEPDWDWRISVADITAAGAFSAFPGVDRQAALIAGRGLELRAAQRRWRFNRPGDLHAFAGEAQISAALHSGPVQLLNLMSARGRGSAALHAHRADARIALCAPACHVLLVAQGVFGIALAQSAGNGNGSGAGAQLLLHPGQGLCVDGVTGQLDMQALAADSCLLHARAGAAAAAPIPAPERIPFLI